MKKYKKPKHYRIVFLDHAAVGGNTWVCEHGLEEMKKLPRHPVECTAWLLAEDPDSYFVAGWRSVSEDDGECSYADRSVILKGTILEMKLTKLF